MKPLLILLAIGLAGCEPPEQLPARLKAEREAQKPIQIHGEQISETEPGIKRFDIKSHGKFRAGFDNGLREILMITDRKTGKEYLGITGVGITELRHETETKTTVSIDPDGNPHVDSEDTTVTRER